MRHRKKKKIISRGTSHRKMLIRNLAKSFFENKKVATTEAKAKLLKPFVEKLITIGKVNNLQSRRKIIQQISSNNLASKIINDIAPNYKERSGGYTRIIKLGPRQGDKAPVVHLVLI